MVDEYLGSGPADEVTPQTVDPEYPPKGKAHCRRWITQLRNEFGLEPTGSKLHVGANPHDFGTYYSVNYEMDESNKDHQTYYGQCESGASTTWIKDT